MTKVIYTPGVCNIGPEEIKKRKTVGYVGLVATILTIVVLFYFHASPFWKVIVFIPAFVAASGFVQAYLGFCVGFAQSGVYNVESAAGTTEKIADNNAIAKDTARAKRLYLYMVLIALAITVVVILI